MIANRVYVARELRLRSQVLKVAPRKLYGWAGVPLQVPGRDLAVYSNPYRFGSAEAPRERQLADVLLGDLVLDVLLHESTEWSPAAA